jgi:hypothetical protein
VLLTQQLALLAVLTVPEEGAVHVYWPEGESGASSLTPPTLQLAGQSAAGVAATPPLQAAQGEGRVGQGGEWVVGLMWGKLAERGAVCRTRTPGTGPLAGTASGASSWHSVSSAAAAASAAATHLLLHLKVRVPPEQRVMGG